MSDNLDKRLQELITDVKRLREAVEAVALLLYAQNNEQLPPSAPRKLGDKRVSPLSERIYATWAARQLLEPFLGFGMATYESMKEKEKGKEPEK